MIKQMEGASRFSLRTIMDWDLLHHKHICVVFWKYGFFGELAQRRQVAEYSNLKHCESLSYFGDIESLEPSEFKPY